MEAGKLRHRITIEVATNTRTAAGSTTQSWATHATVWARILNFGGTERVTANQVESRVTHKVQIRNLSTVTTGMRVNDTDKSRILNILAIEGDETNEQYTWLHCARVI
jgi:SPP1 family predicted phage head-tail adaptor